MAKDNLARLHEIVGKYEPQERPIRDITPPRLMQDAHMRTHDEDVVLSASGKRPQYKNKVAQVGGRKKKDDARTMQISESANDTATAIDGQTQVLKSQAQAAQKQSGMLMQQTGLMQQQIQATTEVSDVVQRLVEYMKAEANKPAPKVQESGHVIEGQFARISEKKAEAQERRSRISEELRRKRSERAQRMNRDARGRFTRDEHGPNGRPGRPRVGPRIQAMGGMGGMAGRLIGGRVTGPLAALAALFYGSAAISAMRQNYVYDRKESGAIASGWQSTKDWSNDFANPDPGKTALDRQTNGTGGKNEGEGIGELARHKDFGSIAESFESGGRGVGTISTGKGDKGGVSYGAHQLATNNGSMNSFLRSGEGSKYYNDFRGLTAGSKEFNDKYTEVVGRDGEGMKAAQKAYIKRENYDPTAKWFNKQYDLNLDERSRALREAVYSIGVQYGPSKAKGVFADALGNRDVVKMDDAEIIHRLQETRAETVEERFSGSSADQRKSIYNRAGVEKVALLKMLNEERQGAGSGAQTGSAIGSQYAKPMIEAYGGKPSTPTQSGTAANGTVGVMKAPAPGGGGGATAGDEAGGGTAAAEAGPENGAYFAAGQKATIPNNSSVNIAGLNQKFKQAFFTMVGDWIANKGGTVVRVESAFRTRMEQEALWVKYGRNTKRVARPGTSRHESGFAIDIDRTSAGAMESGGLFKKYGFHRPLSNEPWHVELIGGGKGGGKGGGGPTTSSATPSPQLMVADADKELEKSADTTVKTAEENTKGLMKTPTGTPPTAGPNGAGAGGATAGPNGASAGDKKAGAGGAPGATDAEAKTNPGADNAAKNAKDPKYEEVLEVRQYDINKNVDARGMLDEKRTPEQQALYEQYLKANGGDPRKVPPTVAAPNTAGTANSGANSGTAIQTSAVPGSPGTLSGNSTRAAPPQSGYGRTARTPVDPTTKAITGVVTRVGNIEGLNSFGSMFPKVNDALRGVDSKVNGAVGDVFGKNAYTRELQRMLPMPSIPRLSSGLPSFGNLVSGAADAAKGLFGGGPAENGVVTKSTTPNNTPLMGQGITAPPSTPSPTKGGYIQSTADLFKAPVDSPASKTYYTNETPIATRATTAPATAMSAVTSTPVAADSARPPEAVQKVVMADQEPTSSAMSSGANSAGAPAPDAGNNNDMPQLSDFSAIVDDLGLLFINSGYV